MKQQILLLLVLIGSLCFPFVVSNTTAANALDDEVLICCEASEVDLFLIGSQSDKKLTPLASQLGEEAQVLTVQNSINSQESLGIWRMKETWSGEVPESIWNFEMAYELSGSPSVRINASVIVTIGSKSFSAQTENGDSVLAQGKGRMQFDIPVERFELVSANDIEVEFKAQAILFNLPGADAKFDILWGSEDDDSKLTAVIPLIDISMIQPEVEGSDIYIATILDSAYGRSTLAVADSIQMKVNGNIIGGDPIETASNDRVRVTWTYTPTTFGVQTLNFEVVLTFQSNKPQLTGSTSFEVETFDTTGGTGTYYPPDEPLKTNGDGSRLEVTIQSDLSKDGNKLVYAQETSIKMYDEMAFWLRWGFDHLGDDNPTLSPVFKSFDAAAVTDDERVSRAIEDKEKDEVERLLINFGDSFIQVGLGLDTEELLGGYIRDFDLVKIQLDLNDETRVVNHPITLKIVTQKTYSDQENSDVLRHFILQQIEPLWASFDLDFTLTSSMFTSIMNPELRLSEDLDFNVLRFPWGDQVRVSGSDVSIKEEFTLSVTHDKNIVYAPMVFTLLLLIAVIGVYYIALKLTNARIRTYIYAELFFIPVIFGSFVLGFPILYVGMILGICLMILLITAMFSPRTEPRKISTRQPKKNAPQIPCPACQVMNLVTSEERPYRFACSGCERIIKLVA